MRVHQLLYARPEIARVMEHGLVGPEGEVGEHDPAAVAGVGTQPLSQGDRQGGRTSAARPAHREELTEPERGGHLA